MLDVIERHPSETVHAQMLEADLAVTRATATVVAISARLPIRPPGMSNTCRGPPGLALLGQSVHGHIGDRLGHARVHDDGHKRGKKMYKNRRLTEASRGPCGSGACDLEVSSDNVTIVAGKPLGGEASSQGDLVSKTSAKTYKNRKLTKASREMSAATVLLIVLRWLRADLVEVILFGRHMLASKYTIANLRVRLTDMLTRLPSMYPGAVVQFTKASAAGPRELRLGLSYTGAGVWLSPAIAIRMTIIGFDRRPLLTKWMAELGGGPGCLASWVENLLDADFVGEWEKQGRRVALAIGSVRLEVDLVRPCAHIWPSSLHDVIALDRPLRRVMNAAGMSKGERPKEGRYRWLNLSDQEVILGQALDLIRDQTYSGTNEASAACPITAQSRDPRRREPFVHGTD